MKVLYVTNLPAPYRVAFFNELGKHVELTVLYERKTAGDRDPRWKGDSAKHFKEIYLNGIPFGDASAISLKILSYIKDPTYDIRIMGGYSSPAAMLAIREMKHRKIPYILSIDGGIKHPEHPWIHRLKTYMISGAAMYLSTGICGDKFLARYGADPEKIFRYHFTSLYESDICSDVADIAEKASCRNELGVTKKHLILSVGRLLPLKRYDLLMQISGQFPDAETIIVGGKEDAYHTGLRQTYPHADVRFDDFVSYQKLCTYFRAADVFVMPSDSDVWGLALAEAMANGLPVIATDSCGASADLIKNEKNGCIVPKGNGSALTEAVGKVLQSDMPSLGKHSLKIIKEYTIEHEVSDHLHAFREFLRR